MQDECRTLLLFSQARAAEVGAARKLDHRLGERHRTSGACVLYRFHMVRSPAAPRANPALDEYSNGYPYSAQMITTALSVGSDGEINLGAGATFGILLAILFTHGLVCSAATSVIARLNIFYVLINGA